MGSETCGVFASCDGSAKRGMRKFIGSSCSDEISLPVTDADRQKAKNEKLKTQKRNLKLKVEEVLSLESQFCSSFLLFISIVSIVPFYLA